MCSVRLAYSAATILAVASVMSLADAAEAYPTRPIRLVTGEVGGGGDFAARIIAQGLSTSLGQTVRSRRVSVTPPWICVRAESKVSQDRDCA